MKILALIFIFSVLLNITFAVADDGKNKEFLDSTIKNFQKKCEKQKGDMDYLNCWAKYSPKKCKSLVFDNDRRKNAWQRCVYTCGSAGIYSKTFGECSN